LALKKGVSRSAEICLLLSATCFTSAWRVMIQAFMAGDQWIGSSARSRANSGKGFALVAGLPRSKT